MQTIRTTIAVLSLAGALSALAQDLPAMYLGTSASASQAERTIVIGPGTKHVNVKEGEVIKFVTDQATFAWKFDGPGSRSFNLQQAAPSGALANPVKVYVQPKASFQ